MEEPAAGATDAAIRSKTGQGWLLELHVPDSRDESGPTIGRRSTAP